MSEQNDDQAQQDAARKQAAQDLWDAFESVELTPEQSKKTVADGLELIRYGLKYQLEEAKFSCRAIVSVRIAEAISQIELAMDDLKEVA